MIPSEISRMVRWVLAVLISASPVMAKQPPPFGDSITWATGKEAPTLEGMRGKSVVVLFFQSWCGICNGWSPELFEQLGKAYGDDPKVVLIALKTDGGSLGDARDYMKSRTDPERWLVGVDENATYYRQATGDDALYYYMWVKPDGSLGKTDKASYHQKGREKKYYVLAEPESQALFRKGAKPLITPPIDEALKPAVKKAELGMYLGALADVGKLSSNAALKESVAKFRERISTRLEWSVKRHSAAVQDEKNEDRYLAYLELKKIENDFGSSCPGVAAKVAAAPYASSAWIAAEEEAASEYQSIMRRAARADDERSRERISKALKTLSEESPDTFYGRLAAAPKR